MTIEQLRNVCPVAFMSEPSNPKVSSHYTHINTATLVGDLEKLGWLPDRAMMRKRRKTDTIYSKHMVVFRNPNLTIEGKVGDIVFPEILLQNSHDGTSSFQFRVGLYRLICSNGMVIADREFVSFRIRHQGYTFEELQEAVGKAMLALPERVEVMNRMQSRELTEEERQTLAVQALLVRAGIDPASDEAKEKTFSPEVLTEVLTPKRPEDAGNSLWTVFNVLQEKVTKGGFRAALAGAKVRKVRPIKSFEKDVEINQKLFALVEEWAN